MIKEVYPGILFVFLFLISVPPGYAQEKSGYRIECVYSNGELDSCFVQEVPEVVIESVAYEKGSIIVKGRALPVEQTIPAHLMYHHCCNPTYLDRATIPVNISSIELFAHDRAKSTFDPEELETLVSETITKQEFTLSVPIKEGVTDIRLGVRIKGELIHTSERGVTVEYAYDTISLNSEDIKIENLDTREVNPTSEERPDKGISEELLIYKKKNNYHVLIVDLSQPDELCFEAHVGLKDKIGSKDQKGNLKKRIELLKFVDLVSDHNAVLNGERPIAAFNTDYVKSDGPININIVRGYDYSGPGSWTSMAISEDNDVTFINEKPEYGYTVTGGGPRLYQDGRFKDLTVKDLGRAYSDSRRTVVGITDNNKMIVLVGDMNISSIQKNLDQEAHDVGGIIIDGNMFDGGGSPSLVIDENNDGSFTRANDSLFVKIKNFFVDDNSTEGETKREGSNTLGAALLIYQGEACQE